MLSDFQNAPEALQTYYNYVQAWVEKISRRYGEQPKCFTNMAEAMAGLESVKKLQGYKKSNKDKTAKAIIGDYTRGKLTLKAMKTFPINDHKELAPTANLWLPVQAYYAVHGLGLAAMLSMGQTRPITHQAFKSTFSGVATKYFPEPLNAMCTGGPDNNNFVFHNLDATSQKVKQLSNLSVPYVEALDCLIGKCLSTTRSRLLEKLFNERRKEVRPGRTRRNLSRLKKQAIADNLHATSVVDFLYRMRIRSNYEEPDIHLYAAVQQTDGAVRHYSNLLFLTRCIIHSLIFIIRKKGFS